MRIHHQSKKHQEMPAMQAQLDVIWKALAQLAAKQIDIGQEATDMLAQINRVRQKKAV